MLRVVILWAGLGLLVGCKTPSAAVKDPVPQTTSPSRVVDALLWRIDVEGSAPSYLFGTIHLIPDTAYFFTAEMQRAFDDTEVLALEIDIEKALDLGGQMAMLQKALMRNDTTLKDLVTPEEYAAIRDHFSKMGLPIFLLERIKPMFLTIFASEDIFGGMGAMDRMKSYELELSSMAKGRQMKVTGLETVESQLGIFDSIPYKAQAKMLVASIEAEEGEEQLLDTLIHYYRLQDLERLNELINADATTFVYRHILLDNRNRQWIPAMTELMRAKPTFFAVGAGHLKGEVGVIALLEQAGYRLTPLRSNAADHGHH